jgi:hypothetical protein
MDFADYETIDIDVWRLRLAIVVANGSLSLVQVLSDASMYESLW